MTADDAFGQSSFNSGQGWADATAPSAGNGYANANFLLRTPADANSYTFGGDSLTITSDQPFGAQLNDALIYKGTGSSTLTINNFTVDGGALRHGNNENQTFTLAGNALTVGPNGMIVHIQGPLTVTSPVLGSGVIRVVDNGSNDARRTLEFTSPASTYNGSIELPTANRSRFRLAGTGVLNFVIGPSGTNNSITGAGVADFNGTFNLDLSAAGTSLGDTWQLVANSTLVETFGDTFAVAGFTDNGDNTWSTAANGAAYRFDESTGALSVVPLPEPASLCLIGLAAPAVLTRRRRT
jgi:hypothetical protein